MFRELTMCSGNPKKREEFQRILGVPLESVDIAIDEIQDIDPEVVCSRKARRAYELLSIPVVVDDTSFGLDALGGFPGALVTWVLQAGGPELLWRMLPPGGSDRATAVTAIGYSDGKESRVFLGSVSGRVIRTARGTNGFGFDSVFVPDGWDKTLAEMSNHEKDRLSPRSFALERLGDFLANTRPRESSG